MFNQIPILVIVALCTTVAFSQTVPRELADKYPGLKVDVKVGTKRFQDERISYKKNMSITPSVLLESSSTRPMAAANMTMLIITMDTKQKYVNRKDSYKVWAKETLAVPAVEKGGRRNFDFKPSMVSFDSWRDTSNFGGMVYKYYIFGMRDAETGKLLHFETNHSQLSSLVRGSPSKIDEFLALAEQADFPTDIR